MQHRSSGELLSRANTLISEGQSTAAIALLKDAITSQPDFFQGWLLLSKCLYQQGYVKEAVLVANKAEQFDPMQQDFRNIQHEMQRQAFAEAEKTAKLMLGKLPGHPRAIFTCAHIAMLQNDPFASVEILLEGLHYSPANLTLRNMLVESQTAAGDFSGGIQSAKQLVSIDESFNSLWLLVTLLLKYGQHDELLEYCDRAAAKCGGDKAKLSQVEMVRGQALRIIGQRDSSIASFKASLAANPNNAEAWWALADMKNYGFSDADRDAIKQLLNASGVAKRTKAIATFAYAKAVESTESPESAMPFYVQANNLQQVKQFEPSRIDEEFDARMSAFSAEALGRQAESEFDQLKPIFIVGLPRSGSTLLEQILASHSQIQGTLEQPTLSAIERQAQSLCQKKYNAGLLASVKSLSVDELTELGRAYLDKGELFRSEETAFFTDKFPFNFRQVGLIHKILPNARIIDIRRNPMDCGLSLYKQYFAAGVDFSYDLAHVGAFYNAYFRLMDHWDKVLPGKVLRVQYEELVKSPEAQIRRVLEYVGVNFEPACLNFHSSRRVVHTASSEQVRQPINTKGIGIWRGVGKSLSLLKDSLSEEVIDANRQYL